jgi:hypothetical protein
VQTAAVIPALDPLEDRALRLAGQERRRKSSFLSEPMKLSQTALSSAQPLEPIDIAMPASRQR